MYSSLCERDLNIFYAHIFDLHCCDGGIEKSCMPREDFKRRRSKGHVERTREYRWLGGYPARGTRDSPSFFLYPRWAVPDPFQVIGKVFWPWKLQTWRWRTISKQVTERLVEYCLEGGRDTCRSTLTASIK